MYLGSSEGFNVLTRADRHCRVDLKPSALDHSAISPDVTG